MCTSRFVLAAAAVLLGGGLLVWSGCGGTENAGVATRPTDSETTADPGAAAPGSDQATPEDPTPAESPGQIPAQPEQPATDSQEPLGPDWSNDPLGPDARATAPAEPLVQAAPAAPDPSPLIRAMEPAKIVSTSPLRLPEGETTAAGQVNPVRPSVRSLVSPQQPLAEPATAGSESAEAAAPTYRMAAPQPYAAPSLAPSVAEARPEAAPSEIADPDSRAMVPRMATMPATEDAADQPTADAARPATESLAASDEPAAPAAEEPDYKMVTVFYGTDRKALSSDEAVKPFYSGTWFMAAAAAGGVTLLLLFVCLWGSPGRTAKVLTGLGMLATAVLAAVTAVDYLQSSASVANLARTYGNERGELEIGTCQVSIPKHHEVGQVERPSLLRGEVYEDPRRHVVLLTINLEDEDRFYSGLEAHVNRSKRKEAFVFVHGFNVTFDEAARRTAQLAYDLDFDGPPIFFSWPSQGGLLKYAVDETNVVWTVPHLKQFLLGVARRSGADSVHLIAHSMGNRALTSALEAIAYEMQDEKPIFREVLLTAPDIDADVFKRDIAPKIVRTAERVTLYASSNDEALTLSKQVHGYPRAGDSGQGLVVVPGIDTIDVSTVDTSLLGHSYYGSNHTVIADMLDLLHDAKPPDQRPFLRPQQLGQMFYWIFNPERLSGLAPQPQPAVR